MWSLAGTVPEKLGNQVTPGDVRRGGPLLAVTQIVSGLLRELVCVESWVFLRDVLLQTSGIHSKKALSHCVRTSHAQQPGQ